MLKFVEFLILFANGLLDFYIFLFHNDPKLADFSPSLADQHYVSDNIAILYTSLVSVVVRMEMMGGTVTLGILTGFIDFSWNNNLDIQRNNLVKQTCKPF